MLCDAAGDIDTKTNGEILFYVDTLGVSGTVKQVRHNCYLRVRKTDYNHLLFRVTAPVPGPWPGKVTTPEGDKNTQDILDETQLRAAIQEMLQRERTNEDLERVRYIACVGYNGGPYDTGQLARGYFAAAHQLFLGEMSVPFDQIDKLPIEARMLYRYPLI